MRKGTRGAPGTELGPPEANRGLLKGSLGGQLSESRGGAFYRECSHVEAESSLSLGLVEQTTDVLNGRGDRNPVKILWAKGGRELFTPKYLLYVLTAQWPGSVCFGGSFSARRDLKALAGFSSVSCSHQSDHSFSFLARNLPEARSAPGTHERCLETFAAVFGVPFKRSGQRFVPIHSPRPDVWLHFLHHFSVLERGEKPVAAISGCLGGSARQFTSGRSPLSNNSSRRCSVRWGVKRPAGPL
jgi:hypothetical protein